MKYYIKKGHQKTEILNPTEISELIKQFLKQNSFESLMKEKSIFSQIPGRTIRTILN